MYVRYDTDPNIINSTCCLYLSCFPPFLPQLLMKVGETFTRWAKAEYIDEESLNALRLFANCKKEFADLAKEIRALKPSEYR